MTEPAIERARVVVFVVGSAAVSVLMVLGVIWAVAAILDIDTNALVDWFISVVVGILGGSAAYQRYRTSEGGD